MRCGFRRYAAWNARELGATAGVTFCLENLNTIVDHPGVPLSRAKYTLALVEAVGHPHVKMMLDLYHAQIGEGNLVELVRRGGDAIGEIQVADVPGDASPGHARSTIPPSQRHARQRIYGTSPWRPMPQAIATPPWRRFAPRSPPDRTPVDTASRDMTTRPQMRFSK